MPRYFFHIQDDTFIEDDKGEVLPDDIEARDAAEYLAEQLSNTIASARWFIVVTNQTGEEIARIRGRTTTRK